SRPTEQRAEAMVEAELRAVVANEVQHGARGLAVCSPQSAAELLEEQGSALGRAEQEECVDVRDVDALVEEVDGEHDTDPPGREVGERRSPLGRRTVAPHSD